MIARLSGTLLEKNPGLLVLDVAGVGYEVTIPLSTFRVVGEPGARVELHVHTHVREDTLALYGFATRLEKELFVRLLAVSGVGPKTAVALLSGLGAESLVEAVRRRDIRRLSGAPGIGRKTAERIALDLADRLESLVAPERVDAAPGGMKEDLVSALVNLGYNARAASEAAAGAIDGAPAEPPFEDLLRRALRTLSR
jgi:Holliday junction DNA helicase RuvA